MNRRSFLKLSAFSSAWLGLVSMGFGPAEVQAQTSSTAYGFGAYGVGPYSGTQQLQTALGDANCDGTVNSVDALAILQHDIGRRTDAGSCPLTDSARQLHLDMGDVDDNGSTEAVDALFILQCDIGRENVFCPGTQQ